MGSAGSRGRTYLAGVLVANSAPHLASAVAKRRHLAPIEGSASGPAVSLGWGLANLAVAAVLVGRLREPTVAAWDGHLHSFEAGFLSFAAWMTVSERCLG